MKKVFQIKLKNITRVFALVMAVSLVTFTGCKSYDEDITDLQDQIDAVVTDVAALKGATVGDYIQSISLGTDGKLTINPSTGPSIVYDAKNYVVYDVSLVNNDLMVNGVKKGTVAPPTLTVAGGFLVVNGTATTVAIPAAAGKAVKDVKLVGAKITVSYTDGSADTTIDFVNAFSVVDGKLAVNGVKTNVAIPAGNSVIINKDGSGAVVSATISDGTDSFTVKVNPGTELLSSILFVPTWIDGGINAVELGYISSINETTYVPLADKVLFNEQNTVFRFNPTTANLSKTTWKFVNNQSRLTVASASNAPGDATTLFATPTYTSNNDGSGNFNLKVGSWVEPAAGKTHWFALQANGKDFYSDANTQVVSDLVKITTAQYVATISNAKKPAFVDYRVNPKPFAVFPIPVGDIDHDLVADNSVITDLDDLVWATATIGGVKKKFDDYGFKDYKFEFSLGEYKSTDATDQNSFVSLNSTTNVLTVNTGSSVIDRTPLVTVKLRHTTSGKLLAYGYIKFQIVAKVTPVLPPTPYSLPAKSFGYTELFQDAVAGVSAGDYKEVVLTWSEMNNKVYNPMGLTHNQFQDLYGPIAPTVTYYFTPGAGSIAPAVGTVANPVATTLAAFPLIRSTHQPDIDTYAMKIQVTPMAKFGTYVVNYKFATTKDTDPSAVITFTYTVTQPQPDKALISAYQFDVNDALNSGKYPTVTTDAAHTLFTQGIKYTTPSTYYAMELNLGEGFGFGSAALKAMFGVGANKIDPATQEFIVTDNWVKSGVPSYLFSQALPSQTSIPALLGTSNSTGVKMGMNPANPLDRAYRDYKVNFKTTYPNNEVHNFIYTVLFRNPLTVELESTADFNLLDVKTGAQDQIDLSKNYVVKMLGEVVFNKTGVVAAKANEYGLGTATQTYASTNVYAPFAYAYTFATPIASWENAGTKLTQPQKVADAVFTYTSSFAIVSRTDAINVNPDLSSPVKRK